MTLETNTQEESAVRPAAGASLHRQGLTGRGVGIAVIDSGVTAPGAFGRRLVSGPDFTVDAGTIDEGRDHTGHGTHLAGIAASDRVGVAPGSHVVSLKVAGRQGATDVNAVIAAIDWTVAHRHELSIGVLLLAFGADQLPAGQHDPLAAAAARASRAGIVVVTSSGNSGQEAPLSTPAHIAEVITVAGAEQADGRWVLSDFSDRGTDACRPDLAAPARSIVGPIAPGSESEQAPETSIVADGFVKGSGTSQAAAVVAGAAALLLEADRSLTPDEIKQILTVSAVRMDDVAAGAGALDLDVALACLASGLFRTEATPATAGAWSGHSWSGLEWAGHSWSGHSWSGLEWAGHSWSGHSWSGLEWAGHSWSGHSWSGLEWAGHSWYGSQLVGPGVGWPRCRAQLVGSQLVGPGVGWPQLVRSQLVGPGVGGSQLVGSQLVGPGVGWPQLVGSQLVGSGVGRVTAGRATAGRAWSGLVTAGRATAGRAWSGLATAGRVTAGRAWSGLATAGRVTAGRAWSGPVTAGRATAGPEYLEVRDFRRRSALTQLALRCVAFSTHIVFIGGSGQS